MGVSHFLSLPEAGSSVEGDCGVLGTGKLKHPVTKAIVCPAAEFAMAGEEEGWIVPGDVAPSLTLWLVGNGGAEGQCSCKRDRASEGDNLVAVSLRFAGDIPQTSLIQRLAAPSGVCPGFSVVF